MTCLPFRCHILTLAVVLCIGFTQAKAQNFAKGQQVYPSANPTKLWLQKGQTSETPNNGQKLLGELSSSQNIQVLKESTVLEGNHAGEVWLSVLVTGKNNRQTLGWVRKAEVSRTPQSRQSTNNQHPPWPAKASACTAPPFELNTDKEDNKCTLVDEKNFEQALHEICQQLKQVGEFPEFCDPSHKTSQQEFAKFTQQLSTAANEIPIECINQSLLMGRDVRPTERKACEGRKSRGEATEVPCVTATMIRYKHWLTNQALKCLSTDDLPLSKREVLSIINHESRFQHNVHYRGGIGLMQLTGSGARDNKPGTPRPSRREWEKVKDSKQCLPFRNVMEDELLEAKTKEGDKVVRICQFLNVKNGLRRSLIYGLSLYKTYLKTARKELKSLKFSSSSERQEAEYRMARMLYNRGPGDGYAALKVLRKQWGKKALSHRQFEDKMEELIGREIGDPRWAYSSKADHDLAKLNFNISNRLDQKTDQYIEYVKRVAKENGKKANNALARSILQKVSWTKKNPSQKNYTQSQYLAKVLGTNNKDVLNKVYDQALEILELRTRRKKVSLSKLKKQAGGLKCY